MSVKRTRKEEEGCVRTCLGTSENGIGGFQELFKPLTRGRTLFLIYLHECFKCRKHTDNKRQITPPPKEFLLPLNK